MAGGAVTRFAPSPTGPLHLGHAFSALTAWNRAKGGTFLLRIEDIDTARCRPAYEAAIYEYSLDETTLQSSKLTGEISGAIALPRLGKSPANPHES